MSTATSMRGSTTNYDPATHHALAVRDPAGRIWFLSRHAGVYAFLRTSDPASARTWSSVREAMLWVDDLPDAWMAQIAGRELLVVPLRVTIGDPERIIPLRIDDRGVSAAPGPDGSMPLLNAGKEDDRGA